MFHKNGKSLSRVGSNKPFKRCKLINSFKCDLESLMISWRIEWWVSHSQIDLGAETHLPWAETFRLSTYSSRNWCRNPKPETIAEIPNHCRNPKLLPKSQTYAESLNLFQNPKVIIDIFFWHWFYNLYIFSFSIFIYWKIMIIK